MGGGWVGGWVVGVWLVGAPTEYPSCKLDLAATMSSICIHKTSFSKF